MISPGIANQIGLVAEAQPKLAKLRQATNGMEVTFVKTIVTEMRKAMESSFKDMPGNEIYSDMVNQVISEKLSSNGHLGLSDAMYKPMAIHALEEEETKLRIKARSKTISIDKGDRIPKDITK